MPATSAGDIPKRIGPIPSNETISHSIFCQFTVQPRRGWLVAV